MSAEAPVIQRPIQTRPSLERELVAAAERDYRLRLAEISQVRRLLSRFDRFVPALAERGIQIGGRRVFCWDGVTLQIMPSFAEARDDALRSALLAAGFSEVGRAEGGDGRCWARLTFGTRLAVKVVVSQPSKGGAA